jgi:hypothetical protein
MRLIDFQAIDNNKSALVKMVSYAAQLCAYKKIDVLEAGGLDAEKINILEILHPYKRKLACWPFFYKAKDPLLLEKLKSADLWAPSFLDGDAAL